MNSSCKLSNKKKLIINFKTNKLKKVPVLVDEFLSFCYKTISLKLNLQNKQN